ncbi:Gfo/Idh/MocA family oxidoreductase [Exilibacterium tricleocarpae]|uniref:Gfo/Idh/MocA family oxidoreductase n=1 Tax=Exilibacterium tricleocarpae TaxID=2591008 RepID=A0A545T691_9GAMM|nr:Gfo/Idh/MocA family oxidoreductase [Exilibacterium tricleocarpae]
MSRRKFLTDAALAGTGVALAGYSYPGHAGERAPAVNIGIIGTGDRGGGLASIIQKIPGIRLAACCDPLPFRLANGMKYADRQTREYSDYRFLLDSKQVDAVVVATPFNTHADIAVDALDAGKHVYCEKTMAYGYRDIGRLCKKVKDANLVFQTGHQYHSSRLYRHIVELVQQGKIGRVAALECQWNRNGDWRRPVPDPKWEKSINWRMYREYSGGLMAELCSHQIDFSNWVLGAHPVKVTGFGGIDFWQDGRETYDNVHVITEYPSGVKAKYSSLTTNRKDGYQIKIMGKEGTIVINKGQAWLFSEAGKSKDKAIVDGVTGATQSGWGPAGVAIDIEHKEPSLQAMLDFKQAVLSRTNPQSNVKSGAEVSVVVQMALDAMDNGRVEHWKDEYNFAG